MPKGHYERRPREAADDATLRVRLTHRHGFVDHNGRARAWEAGDVVDDPAEIALLIERGAHVVEA